uniref:Retrovirus-related Pol polyprotein from transposon TNT 1-94 n=1 Tax=Cajanus cajan TaxID=3821 RepID=A0A151SVE7_CAJCA|nr:hypothetical protein KK1_014159 [Cajanus cajan]
MSILFITEPKPCVEASKNACWLKAMHDEITALEAKNTWLFTNLPSHKIALRCHWMYKVKYYVDGSIKCYKVLIVAKGYTKIEGLNFLGIFSPIAIRSTR